MTETYPDDQNIVRNVEVKVAPRCAGSAAYKPQVLYKLKRHTSKLIVIVPVEEQGNDEAENNSIDQHSLLDVKEDLITEEIENVDEAELETTNPEV